MQGRVYQVVRPGKDDGQPHPHVVVVEISGSRECLVVPAYGKEGFKVQEFIDAEVKLGYPQDQVYIELDNARHVTFVPPFTGKPAFWLTAKVFRMSVRDFGACAHIGNMDPSGLSLIAGALLRLAESKPERFSAPLCKKLKQVRDANHACDNSEAK